MLAYISGLHSITLARGETYRWLVPSKGLWEGGEEVRRFQIYVLMERLIIEVYLSGSRVYIFIAIAAKR